MKSITILIAAFFTLATMHGFSETASLNLCPGTVDIGMLAPVTPSVATFEEMIPADAVPAGLAPVVPSEADFSDQELPAGIEDFSTLAPATPGEADFESPEEMISVYDLAPVTPADADFSDGF